MVLEDAPEEVRARVEQLIDGRQKCESPSPEFVETASTIFSYPPAKDIANE